MTAVKVDHIKELRELTSAGVSDCRKALEEAKGDKIRAIEILKKRGLDIAKKKAGRTTGAGRVEAYIHSGAKLGVLVEIDCETDFVARNDEFLRLSKDVAMQIAAANPLYIDFESVPQEVKKNIKENELEDFLKKHCLLDQAFIKDPAKSVRDYIVSIIAKVGENIIIKRFTRFCLGEE
jgi:elongation factor Ts